MDQSREKLSQPSHEKCVTRAPVTVFRVVLLGIVGLAMAPFVVLLLWLSGCTPPDVMIYNALNTENMAGVEEPRIEWENYRPFYGGGDTLVTDLGYEASFELVRSDDLPVIDCATALLPVASAVVRATYPTNCGAFEPGSALQCSGTEAGYEQLVDGTTDILLAAYPSESQLAYAEECDVTLTFTPIGREGFVFFVNPDNPVDGLTSDELRGIYAGEIKDWSEVGGAPDRIWAYQRNEGSGSQSALITFMGGVSNLAEAPSKKVIGGMSGMGSSVARSSYTNSNRAIGFSFRYYVEEIKDFDVKMLSVDGIEPTANTIAQGTYPLTSDFYAVNVEGNDNFHVDEVIRWLAGPEGQDLVAKTGYAPCVPLA